ncbi:conserved virulence factor C family protein [Salsuginibacillus kocurii]|uniref:conserved virulence factor C family protein n=1 Tax=Salsuginibacillus kocurii TaxID=427078 RepID=UPI00037D087D|nr:conserved virulence factor C family protein [Salsuginibacillus kocurii]
MKIVSIEPTPSPNTMKLNLDQSLPSGTSNNYRPDNKEEAPEAIQKLFTIEGIKGVYHVADFIALERHPKADWQEVLKNVRAVFGEGNASYAAMSEAKDAFGEIQVQVQVFKGIPMQVKVTDGEEEKRAGLPDRFQHAAFQAQQEGDNLVMERKWEDRDARYGSDLEEVGAEVAEEIVAAYSEERLNALVKLAHGSEDSAAKAANRYMTVTEEMLDEPDWKTRYAYLDRMNPTEADLPVLDKALDDEKPAIRRLATAYLGMIETSAVLPYLKKALQDTSVTVRRTAGDCMSDIGDPEAMGWMIDTLKDKNKLVRWRGAMFLYELGDERALPALREAQHDTEFEVAMQAKMALERIETGEEAKGSIWKQMTETIEKKKDQ